MIVLIRFLAQTLNPFGVQGENGQLARQLEGMLLAGRAQEVRLAQWAFAAARSHLPPGEFVTSTYMQEHRRFGRKPGNAGSRPEPSRAPGGSASQR